MGQCYPSKSCNNRCSLDDQELFSYTSQPNLVSEKQEVPRRRQRHSHPPHTFSTLYRRSKIVNKQLFLNSGFMEDDYWLTPALEQPSRVTEITDNMACNTSKAESCGSSDPIRRVISATFAYSVSVRSTESRNNSVVVPRLVYDLSHASFNIPRLVYDVTADRSTIDDNLFQDNIFQDKQGLSSPTFDTDTPTIFSTPSPRTHAGKHCLPLVTKISLDSMNSDTSPKSDLGRFGECDMETVAYF